MSSATVATPASSNRRRVARSSRSSARSNARSAANSATPAEISRPFGLTEPARFTAIGVATSANPASMNRPPSRTTATAAPASSNADMSADTRRATTIPPRSGHTSSGRPVGR